MLAVIAFFTTKSPRQKGSQMTYKNLSNEEETIATSIVDAAYHVHKNLGPGLLEKIYESCFCHELKKRGLYFERQKKLPIHYDGLEFDEGLQLDVLVENKIICELKAHSENNQICSCNKKIDIRLSDKLLIS